MRVRLNLNRLKQELSKSNKSQNHWAITLGLSRGHLSEILNGRHPYPSPKTREKLLLALGLAFEDLFELEPGTGMWSHESSVAFQKALYGRYVIDHEIGEGGMGSVYLARDLRHGRRVAVKVISPEAVSGIGTEQFFKEIRYSAGLQHPHIIPLYDSGASAGYPFFVMPYVSGGSLRDRLRKKRRFTLRETLPIVESLCDALEHAHTGRVVHCDIKPENILFEQDHVYLADFGVSRVIHSEVRALGKRSGVDTSAGTPAYVSPEQAAGEDHIDARADIYSLACVVFEMLAGHQPFSGNTATEVVAERFVREPPRLREFNADVPDMLGQVLLRAMAVDRNARYWSVTDFVGDFRRAVLSSQNTLLSKSRSIVNNVTWQTGKAFRGLTAGTPRIQWLAQFGQDFQFALRGYRKRWARTAILLVTAALGIGINTAVFSVVYAVLLRPLPYPDPDNLIFVDRISLQDRSLRSLSMATVDDIDNSLTSLQTVGAFTGTTQSVVARDASYRVPAYVTTEAFFDVLSIPPAIGTNRSDTDGSPVAILSHAFWQSAFGGDSSVVGETIRVSGNTVPIVGVMPPGFAYPQSADIWMPQNLRPFWGPSRSAGGLRLIARRSPDVTVEAVQSELSALARNIRAREPVTFEDADLRARGLQQMLASDGKRTLLLLFVVVGAVLLIACSNIAAVMSADVAARRGEMVVRQSLGAAALRLVRQLLTESVVLGLAAALIALIVAVLSLQLVNGLVPNQYLHSGPATLDLPVATFTVTLGIVTGFLFGLAPAIRVSRLSGSENNAARRLTSGRRDRTLGQFLVAVQYALSLAVVVVALLTVKSLTRLLSVDTGFTAAGRVTTELDMSGDRYETAASQTAFRQEVLSGLLATPGVRAASFISAPPLVSGANLRVGFYTGNESQIASHADWRTVDPDLFATMGITLIAGRDFSREDNFESPGVVIVNQTLARSVWANDDAIGRRIKPELEFLQGVEQTPEGWRRNVAGGWLTVVGVVSNTVHYDLGEDPVPAVYIPAQQHPVLSATLNLVLSVDNSVGGIEQLVRRVVGGVDPTVRMGSLTSIAGHVTQSASTPRFRAGLVSAFAFVALALALLGMYGVTSQSLQQRQGEMAIRVALGADRARIVKLLTGEGMRLVLAGQIFGTMLIVLAGRPLSALLYDATAFDVNAYLFASSILAAAVLLSAYFPARRAGKADPVRALRA